METIWLAYLASAVVLPVTALVALRWAVNRGEFTHMTKTALMIFDEEEPVGQITDGFPGRKNIVPVATAPDPNREFPASPSRSFDADN